MITTNLKNLLESKKISINKLSSETGLSRPTLTALVNNESKGIQFDTLERLLDYFEISTSDFFNIYNENVVFSFASEVPLSKVKEIENAPFSSTKTGKLVEVNPSTLIPYTCKITIDEKDGEIFNATVGPILDHNRVVAVGLLFFRNDELGNMKPIPDIKSFIKKLDGDVLADLVRDLLNSWYKRYRLVSKAHFSEMFIVNLTLLDERKVSYPILVGTIKISNTNISFDLSGYKYSGVKQGDSDFSNSVIIEEKDLL